MKHGACRRLASALSGTAALVMTLPVPAAEPEPLVYHGLSIEQLEYRFGSDSDVFAWDADGFVGTDELKFRLQSEGEYVDESDEFETLENRLLVQWPVSEFFDAKAGVRFDTPAGPNRTYALLGVHGLAPQWIEMDADLFLSEEGDVSARFEADYELLLTNRLILTPSVEVDVAFSDDAEIGIGSGVSKMELGLRLSYDLVDRTLSPYAGVSYERKFGRTADFANEEGEDDEAFFVVAGMRLLF